MMMAMVAWEQAGTRVFHYGFLSSRASGALKEYLDTGQLSKESREALQDAHDLLLDILAAQKLFSKEKETIAPSEAALNAFSCALEVIIAHQEDFGVKDLDGLSRLFETLRKVLQHLVNSADGYQLAKMDVEKTRMFFKRLAELMLAQLSVPRKEKAPILI
jgi:hypothetical protein